MTGTKGSGIRQKQNLERSLDSLVLMYDHVMHRAHGWRRRIGFLSTVSRLVRVTSIQRRVYQDVGKAS